MEFSTQSVPPSARLAALTLCATASMVAESANLTTLVRDRDGQAVEEVVVFAVANGDDTVDPVAIPSEPLVMNQASEQFQPHILVAQVGRAIAFPNGDDVAHHVYSFSESKRFELPLYQGAAHPPVMFDRTGVVDVGCNIHDHMEAHIVVVDTPYFGATSADGRAVIADLPSGSYSVQFYSPRLRAADQPSPRNITVEDGDDVTLQIRLEGRLRPPHVSDSESLNWSRY